MAELGRRISSAELAEWRAYALVEPFGQPRADDGVRGMLALTAMANGAGECQPSDFLKAWRPQADIDEDAALAAFVAGMDAMADQAMNEEGA